MQAHELEYAIHTGDLETVDTCPVCSGKTFNDIAHAECANTVFLTTCICLQCGLIFRRLRPKLEWFKRAWHQRASLNPGPASQYNVSAWNEQLRYRRYTALASALGKLTVGRRILDIGCGPGAGLKSFKDRGWQCVGIEPDSQRAEIAVINHGLEVYTDDVEEWSRSGERRKFDLVTVVQVLEHFHNPRTFLQACANFLESEGLIYIEVPDAAKFVNWRDALYLEHMSNFSESNLIELARTLNLEPRYRLYPRTRPFGVDHLGIVFQKEVHAHRKFHAIQRRKISKRSLRQLVRAYFRGSPKGVSLPLIYRIDRITDIATSVPSAWFPFRARQADECYVAPTNDVLQLLSMSTRRIVTDNPVATIRKILSRLNSRWPGFFVDRSFDTLTVRPFVRQSGDF